MENLAKALVKAQSQLRNLGKNAKGYGYEYLTLDKIIDETRGVLAEHGLVIVQPLGVTDDGRPLVKTILLHESGESISGAYPITAVTMKQCNDAQQMGAAITYARRYGLAAILNIAQADDDGACIGNSSPSIEEKAWDMFDKVKDSMTAEQRQWCMDELKKNNHKEVIKYLKG